MKEQELLAQYWLVSRCWSDHKLSVRNRMSSERAIHLLSEAEKSKSASLRRRASKLLHDIIYVQEEPAYLKSKI